MLFEKRGRYLSNMGFMWVAVSAGVLLRAEHVSNSARTARKKALADLTIAIDRRRVRHTSESIDSPLLKLL